MQGQPIYANLGKPGKKLNQVTKDKRLDFCRKNKYRNWSHVLFTDRVKISFDYPGVKVRKVQWLKVGEKREATKVNHAKVVNVYAGIGRYGVTDVHKVAGSSGHKTTYFNQRGKEASNITSDEYVDVVKKTFLPCGRAIFSGAGIASWTLQQDNDPTHKVAEGVIAEWNKKHSSSVQLLQPWPPSSPDLNPIENVWGYVQKRVNELGCDTFPEFEAAVLDEIKNVPKSMLVNLVKSMGKRMQACIKAEGDKTKY